MPIQLSNNVSTVLSSSESKQAISIRIITKHGSSSRVVLMPTALQLDSSAMASVPYDELKISLVSDMVIRLSLVGYSDQPYQTITWFSDCTLKLLVFVFFKQVTTFSTHTPT